MELETRFGHLPLLGSGRFGKVYGKNGKALKVVQSERTNGGVHDEIIREATIAAQVRFFQERGVAGSDRVVQFLGASLAASGNMIEFQLEMVQAPGGSLYDLIAEDEFKCQTDMIETLLKDIKIALLFCQYTCGILVRDISPNNILISNVEPARFVLADFGKSRPVPDNLVNVEYSDGYHGAPLYQPPRAFFSYAKREKYGLNTAWEDADFYSLASIALCMCDCDEFWGCAPTYSEYQDMVPLYIAFCLEGIPHLLKKALQRLKTPCLSDVPKWINRELKRVEQRHVVQSH